MAFSVACLMDWVRLRPLDDYTPSGPPDFASGSGEMNEDDVAIVAVSSERTSIVMGAGPFLGPVAPSFLLAFGLFLCIAPGGFCRWLERPARGMD